MVTEWFRILGRVGDPVFAVWIRRHAARLGLAVVRLVQVESAVEVVLRGPADLLDAMELGCSLGPWQVWVDRIERVAREDEYLGQCEGAQILGKV